MNAEKKKRRRRARTTEPIPSEQSVEATTLANKHQLNRNRLLLVLIVAGLVLVYAPALHAPVALDDYVQRAMIEGKLTPHRGALNLYALIDDANRAAQLARGALPWWSDPGVKISFLRPIPSALVWLDFKWWSYEGFAPHVHSLLWWAAAVFAAFHLFSELFSPRTALIAAVVFALSPAHMLPVVWLANRNALVTVTLGAVALLYHLRWRESLNRWDGLCSSVLWAVTLLTGEYALCFAGYVIALEFFRRTEPFSRRAIGIATYAVPASLYLLTRGALGYGVGGSGLYASPLHGAPRVIANAPRALGTLLGAAWICLDESWSSAASPELLAATVAGLVVVIGFACRAAVRRLDRDERNRVLWLLCGSLLALIPSLPARASTRFLGVAALGASAVIGVIIEAAWNDRRRLMSDDRSGREAPALGVLGTLVATGLVYAHGVSSPMASYGFASSAASAEEAYDRSLDFVRARSVVPISTLVVLRGITPPTALTIPFMLRDAAPRRLRVLTETAQRITVARPEPTVLVITPTDGSSLLRFGTADPTRGSSMHVDEQFSVPGLRVTVLAVTEDQEPLALRFEFDRDLDEPSFHWMIEGVNGFRDATMPPVGKQLNVSL